MEERGDRVKKGAGSWRCK